MHTYHGVEFFHRSVYFFHQSVEFFHQSVEFFHHLGDFCPRPLVEKFPHLRGDCSH